MPGTPVFLSGAQMVEEEHEALIRAIKQKTFPIFLFNEMNMAAS